jgi:uncharacterized membrane-anchored protein YhcB (DUF1043 family)
MNVTNNEAESIKSGIEKLYDMECSHYLMYKLIESLSARINSLGKPNCFPNITKGKNNIHVTDGLLSFSYYFGLCFGIIGALIFIIIVWNSYSFFEKIGAFIILGIILLVCGMIIGAIIKILIACSNRDYKQLEIDNEYKKNCEIQKNEINEDIRRVKNELLEKEKLTKYKNALLDKMNETARNLNNYYIEMGIDVSYRNFIPIAYMNEYIRTKVSTKFDGVDGLYYLVHQDLRADQLQMSIDEISAQLQNLCAKVTDLYQFFNKSNEVLNNFIDCPRALNSISSIFPSDNIADIYQYIQQRRTIECYYTEWFDSYEKKRLNS